MKETLNHEQDPGHMTLKKTIVHFDLKERRASAGAASLYAKQNPVDFAKRNAAPLDDPAFRERLGEIGRAWIENGLSWGHSALVLPVAYERAFASAERA